MTRAVLVSLLIAIASCGGQERVVVAAGTTIVDSGLIDLIASAYEESHPGIELSVVGEATAQVLELGRRGAADVMITHAPEAERRFVAAESPTRYVEVFVSRFVLVAPPGQADRLARMDVVDALQAIADEGLTFVTRADGSGTHAAERSLWASAGIDPTSSTWYLETGQGMGLTLQVTDQMAAITLTELGAFVSAAGVLSITEVDVQLGPAAHNPYHATVLASGGPEAERFVDWLTSAAGQAAIRAANTELYGSEQIYTLP